jgi:PAS domain S-box-containing protein
MRHTLLTLEPNAPQGFESVAEILPCHLTRGTFALWASNPASGEAAVRAFADRLPVLLVSPSLNRPGLEHLSVTLYRLNLPEVLRDEAYTYAASLLDLLRSVSDANDRGQSFAINLSRAAEDRRRLGQEFAAAREKLMQELAERRNVERALRESEERYRSILDSVSDAVSIHDAESCTILQVNRRMCELFRCAPEEALDFAMGDISSNIPPYTHAEAVTRMRMAAKGVPQIFEWHARDRQGNLFWADMTMRHATIGSQSRIIVTVRDITSRKEHEEAQRRMNSQIQHTQRLESLGMLAGAIAHDFNNLLTAVLGNVDLAVTTLAPNAPGLAYLKSIDQAARQATDLCRQLLAYAGKGGCTVQRMGLAHLIQEMVYILDVSIPKKVRLRYQMDENLPLIEGDASQLRQVLLNLVVNAAEAIGDQPGDITVTAGTTRCDNAFLAACLLGSMRSEGEYVTLKVTDTGLGMDPSIIERIFDPFFTTKLAGRGLGLAAVLGIVRAHHGAIHVTSELSHGTTITILFPALSGTLTPAQPETPAEPSDALTAWQGHGTILIVDDEETVRTLAGNMLTHLGFQILQASNGEEALERFRTAEAGGQPVTCVILDLTMPRMDGEESFRELQKIRKDVCVLLSSGYPEETLSARFSNTGLAGFLQKPYRLASLQRKLAELLPPG